ncbi:RHS repeat-associated core domain-containing protein [Desulfococcaceae bacterium HSG9]|nr:RHS repeat-associated core domain-containing protein [Desulfococcaceae bacterium HSG9]
MKTLFKSKSIFLIVSVLTIVWSGNCFAEIPVYRLYNTVSKTHLYSTDANEKDILEAHPDWNYEGIAWYGYESDAGQYPVYRLYSPGLGKHLFTMDENEKNFLEVGPVWRFELIAWYSDSISDLSFIKSGSTSDIPIYRLYSDLLKQHLFTADVNEKNTLDGNGVWVYEGIAFYAAGASESTLSPASTTHTPAPASDQTSTSTLTGTPASSPTSEPTSSPTPAQPLAPTSTDDVDNNNDGPAVSQGEKGRFKISVKAHTETDEISQVRLDVRQILVCGESGGCEAAGGPVNVNLMNAADAGVTLDDILLTERNITQVRFVLGENSTVTADGVVHPLNVPNGDTSGLKLIVNTEIRRDDLNEILVDFDPADSVIHNPGQGYILKPVIKLIADITAPIAAHTTIIDSVKGGKLRKPGKFEMTIPPGAVDTPSILWEITSEDADITSVHTLGPENTKFLKPLTVRLAYNPNAIPQGLTEDDLVVLHDDLEIDTLIDRENKTLEADITHFSDVQGGTRSKSSGWSCGDEREGLYDNWETFPSGAGPDYQHTWGLINKTSCPIEGFTVGQPEVFVETASGFVRYDGPGATVTSSTTFSLAPNYGRGQVTVDFNFTLPDARNYKIYFEVIMPNGEILPHLPGATPPGYKRLWTVVGANFTPCFAPPPSVESVDHVSMGYGPVNVKAEVLNALQAPMLSVNDNESTMQQSSSADAYAGGDKAGQAQNTNQVMVVGGCDLTAFLKYAYGDSYSNHFGNSKGLNDLCEPNSNQILIADPVNTAIGNFIQQETDAVVAGLGGTTINMQRTYNSQALLWTPASMRRYYPDGSDEVIAEPPQYFGKGWASVLGQYLLKIDMDPVFKGVQILYEDGHTANFKEDGDGTYISDTPGNHDTVFKDGDEYVLQKTDCQCSLESKRFGSEGKLLSLSDRNGNLIKLIYAGDMLAAVENASGRRIEFDTNSDGRITKARLPEGISLSYEYNDDLLTAYTDGRGHRTRYRYDGEGQMTEIISAKGHPIVRNTYDDEYRVAEQIVGENEKYVFTYEDGRTHVTDAYGNTHVHHYDDQLRLEQLDYPDGTSELFTYDDDSNRAYYMDQDGKEWHWTYDDKGNRLTADGPLGWHREWAYNNKNQVTRMAEKIDVGTARATTFEYDTNGNMTVFCNALGDCGSVAYDSHGLPVQLTDFAGNATLHGYDAEGDLTAVTDAEGAIRRFDHDGLGRVIAMTKPLGNRYDYTYDANSNLIAVDGPLSYHLAFGFDPNDLLEQKIDPNSGVIRYVYNLSDKPVQAINQLEFSTARIEYGLMNERTGFTDAEGREWNYAYNNMLRLTQVSGPLDVQFAYQYNPTGKITDHTDANGIITHTEYDALYRPVTVIRNYRPALEQNADTNVTVAYQYNLVGDLLKMTDPEDYVFNYAYDLQSRRIYSRDPEGYEWEFTYNPMGKLLETLNPRSNTTSLTYTPTYRLQTVTDPENHVTAYTHDANGNRTDKVDAKGVVTHFDHNALDRRERSVRNYRPGIAPDSETNVTSEYVYDPAGNLRFLTNPRGYQAEFIFDAAHRKIEQVDFEQGRTRYAYDRVNNLLSVTDANGNTTNYNYDDLNRRIGVTNAENEAKGFEYDPMGNRTAMIEADDTVTLYGHDHIYRLNSVTQNYRADADPNNDTNVSTRYGYDARGLLTWINNANGALTAFDYDGVGKMIRETDPLGNTWAYTYDGMGNRATRTDAEGALTRYDYYPDELLALIRYADGNQVSYAYDANHNRTKMEDWLGVTNWAYDPLNRLIGAEDPFSRNLAYMYDAASNRTGLTYADGNQVNYTYSPNNWMSGVSDPKDLPTQYTRDKVGNITHIANPNFTETDVTYDDVYRTLTRVNRQIRGGKKLHSAFDYTYNLVGHVTRAVKEYGWRNPPEQEETYTYDGLHRLAGVKIDPLKNNGEPVIMNYAYDPAGNRMSWSSNDDLSTQEPWDAFTNTYTYNAANQMLTVNIDSVKNNPNRNLLQQYTYDSNGNRINKLESDSNGPIYGADYTFDPENRLTQVLDYQLVGNNNSNRIDRAVTDLEYDGGGRRLVKHYDPKSNDAKGVDKRVEYVFDGLDPVAEYNMLNGQRDNYYRGAMNQIITMHHFNSGTKGQMYWYHYNSKRDVAGLTKQNGNSHHNYRYDPYGGVIPDTGNFTDPHNHYTLTGKEFDENTGLVWFGARHYDPNVGVWMTQDVYRGDTNNPMSLNRYAYVDGNPTSHYDWMGFMSKVSNNSNYLNNYLMMCKADQYNSKGFSINEILKKFTSGKIAKYPSGVIKKFFINEMKAPLKAFYNTAKKRKSIRAGWATAKNFTPSLLKNPALTKANISKALKVGPLAPLMWAIENTIRMFNNMPFPSVEPQIAMMK